MMMMMIWIGVGLSVVVALFAWQLCRAAKQMDEMFDGIDNELERRAKK